MQRGVAADHPQLVPGQACRVTGDGRPAFEAQPAVRQALDVHRDLDSHARGADRQLPVTVTPPSRTVAADVVNTIRGCRSTSKKAGERRC